MRIVDVEAFVCKSQLKKPMWSLQSWRGGLPRIADFIESVIIKVSSSDGLAGYGQTVGVRFQGPKILSIGEECKRLVEKTASPKIRGDDYIENEVIWRKLWKSLKGEAYGREVLSGIDVALWDLKGKALGLPLYALLGGAYRKAVRLYASKVPGLKSICDEKEIRLLIERLRFLIKRGYTAFKLGGGLGVESDIRSVEVARETVGSKCKIMFDAGCVYDLKEAFKLGKHLQDLDVEWFETPLPPNEMKGYAELSRSLDIKIATDAHPDPSQVLSLLTKGGVDVVLSDVTSGGGITVSRRIAEMTELFNVEFSVHAGWHISAIGYAASAHLSASVPNLNFQEGRIHFDDNPLGNPILKEPLKVENGYLRVPEDTGLGVEIDEESLLRYKKE
ncbi:TPA: mandelate racemase/muconate lactonizing enzyme family protein [Candidatus Bathyarchaeota archaeon]|nr:mandelate racemase/muconate lactonizing enzyme family protein [Candidatus Bathyarchaeota archaeon]